MPTDLLFYFAAVPAVVLTGISKGGFGGVALLAVPLMSLVISPLEAAGIMLPLLILMDGFSVWAYRRELSFRNLRSLLPGAAAGIAIGWLTAAYTSEDAVRLIVGCVAVAFTLYMVLFRRNADGTRPHAGKGAFWGGVAGYTSYVAHAGSPPLQVYLLPQRLPKAEYASTAVLFFAVVNLIKVPPYIATGQIDGPNLLTGLILSPLVPLGVWLGVRLNRVIPERAFYNVVYAMAFTIGCKLIWDYVASL
ncbi:MAG: sulfite exporter TauE/SafE family protein [Rhodospirillales bacterium]